MSGGLDIEVVAARDGGGSDLRETVQAYLRRVTRPWHDAVESAFAPDDLTTLGGLGGFLARQAAAVLPLEQALEEAGIAGRVFDWPARRRSEALLADLRALGGVAPAATPRPDIPSTTHALGSFYVLEGSKLGGRVLLRRVQASLDGRVRGATRFLGHHRTGEWPRVIALLQGIDVSELADLRAGAEAAFALFRAAATGVSAQVGMRPLVDLAHA